jgi:serine/threonine protein kinase
MGAKAPNFVDGQLLPGTKYRIIRQIGAGGMGVVYQVVKPPEIQGVLKLMSSDLTEHEEFRTRFLDEVRVLAQIDHPNIVKVFDYDTLPDKTPFYVMELLHGRTVRDVLATMGTLPPRVAFEVTRQLCEALHCAHTHDIPVIHRDIKPENIFLHAPRHGEPVVKLIDFGVVAIADREHDGTFVGTWKYAAPEQIRGERATPATDLYAVGLVLYEMLCGIGPFEHLDSGSLVSQAHLREIPPPVSKFAPWVPPTIVQLIAAALAKDPRQRPRDAYAFAERLYELEWANDGKDPNERTMEGPLSRILSTVGGEKPSSKNLVAAPPKDRLGNVPVVGVPVEARHGGPTLKGVGGAHEPTTPGEDALLAGLVGRSDARPRSKKELESGGAVGVTRVGQVVARAAQPVVGRADVRPRVETQATADAPADTNADFGDGTTRKLTPTPPVAAAAVADTDTFASQESDARRASKRSGGKLVLPILLGLLLVIGGVSFAAYRTRTVSSSTTSSALQPVDPRSAIGATTTTTATPSNTPVVEATATTTASAPVPPPSSQPPQPPAGKRGRNGKPLVGATSTTTSQVPTAVTAATTMTAPPAAASPLGSMPAVEVPKKAAPATSKIDESFIHAPL